MYQKILNHKSDLYAILGLKPGASPDEIKRAYRHLVKKYHPDRTSNPADHARFREIQSAYEYLTGKAKKKKKHPYQNPHPTNAKPRRTTSNSYHADPFKRRYGISKEEWLRRKAQSERIRQKHSEEAYHSLKTGFIWAVIFAFCISVVFPTAKSLFTEWMISRNPASTFAYISYAFSHEIGLNFTTPHGQKRAEIKGKYFAGTTFLPNLFPAEKNDLYLVKYYRHNPKYFKVDFYDLPHTTLEKYIDICQQVIQSGSPYFSQLHPDKITDFIREVYDEFGLTGLCMIYHHSTAFYQNLRFNSLTFYFFTKNNSWKQLLKKHAR